MAYYVSYSLTRGLRARVLCGRVGRGSIIPAEECSRAVHSTRKCALSGTRCHYRCRMALPSSVRRICCESVAKPIRPIVRRCNAPACNSRRGETVARGTSSFESAGSVARAARLRLLHLEQDEPASRRLGTKRRKGDRWKRERLRNARRTTCGESEIPCNLPGTSASFYPIASRVYHVGEIRSDWRSLTIYRWRNRGREAGNAKCFSQKHLAKCTANVGKEHLRHFFS